MGGDASLLVLISSMRILRLLITFLVWLALLSAFVYFIGTRLWLFVGSTLFIQDAQVLVKQLAKEESFADRCAQAPTASSLTRPKALQLRFLNESDFVVEIVCSFIEDSPIQLYESSLPPFVRKAAGASGFYFDLARRQETSIRLQVFSHEQDLTFTGLKVLRANLPSAPAAQPYPATACTAFGLQCCTLDVQRGVGNQMMDGVTDCPRSCYAACAAIPYLQSFSADPYPEANNEVVLTSPTQDVVFSYTASHADGQIRSVEIDYGDGKKETSNRPNGVFTHTYTCETECRYPVVIRATDSNGNVSVANTSSTLYIVRR